MGAIKMMLHNLQITVLLTCLGLMFAQLVVKNKRTTHILFAIFCGSVAMSIAKTLSGSTIGPYQYLIGMGACITCNGYWLLSRSLFRKSGAIGLPHLVFAGAIAVLIMLNQGMLFASNSGVIALNEQSVMGHILREFTVLLSSSILVLSFWEGVRGFRQANHTEKAQRILFLATFGGAVAFSKVLQGALADAPVAKDLAIACITLIVVTSTQVQILWHDKTRKRANKTLPSSALPVAPTAHSVATASQTNGAVDESLLANQIDALLNDDALYLQSNLRLADVAQKLGVPEYRVSNALRYNLKARNFNQYVNALRIQHAQALLADEDKQKWTVLVVGLESGFASVGPFTRAFKATTGLTPNQYRQQRHQMKTA